MIGLIGIAPFILRGGKNLLKKLYGKVKGLTLMHKNF
jgi:hypothetical protein